MAAGCGSHREAGSCDGPCPQSKINHVVVIVQENHTFDSYFGRYCGTVTSDCEAAPAADPKGHAPIVLDDDANATYDPDHEEACEHDELDGGKMDRFVDSSICGDARNVAYGDAATMQPYWELAAGGALADRWFQPTVGASAANDMFLFDAAFIFPDNLYAPDAAGHECGFINARASFDETRTIGHALAAAGVSWTWYAEGYASMLTAERAGKCPDAPDDCTLGIGIYPCIFDPSDIPAEYYPLYADQSAYVRDYASFAADLSTHVLPQVAFVKGAGYHSEHPGLRTTISDGARFVRATVDAIAASDYAPDTLVLVVYDEGGGFFDHVPPPPAVDEHPYGTRVPAIAVGPLARKGAVSHVTMEHSSIVKFLEWNWLAQTSDMGPTGQLGARDAVVANIGSLLDPALGVPEN